MKKIVLTLLILGSSNITMADATSCSDAVGFWMGTYHIKNVDSDCPEGFDVVCQRGAAVAIALKKTSDQYHYTAELFPQFGEGGTVNMYCTEGKMEVINDKIPAELLPKISFQCDEMKNCTVHYDDSYEQAVLSKQWEWASYTD